MKPRFTAHVQGVSRDRVCQWIKWHSVGNKIRSMEMMWPWLLLFMVSLRLPQPSSKLPQRKHLIKAMIQGGVPNHKVLLIQGGEFFFCKGSLAPFTRHAFSLLLSLS